MKNLSEELQLAIAWIAFLRAHREAPVLSPESFKKLYEEELQNLHEDKDKKLKELLAAMPDIAEKLIISKNQTFSVESLDQNKLLAFLHRGSFHELKTFLSSIHKQLQKVEILEKELSFIKDAYLKDDLTHLWNRNGLRKYFSQVVEPNIRESKFALFFFDLDKFKQINDSYGHEVGDRALKHFADFLIVNFRDSDFIARVYGDEFVAMPALMSAEDAIKKAEELVLKTCFMKIREKTVPLRFSLGLTAIRRNDTLKEALSRADESMYMHKRTKKVSML